VEPKAAPGVPAAWVRFLVATGSGMDRVRAPWEHARTQGEVVLVLVRHGQTAWNATRRFLGRTDVPLDATGLAQARRAAAALPEPLSAVYSSPLSRALRTARAVVDDPVVVEDLAELNQGALEGLDGPTAIQRFPDFFRAWAEDPEHATVPGGERLRDLQDRVLAAMGGIARRHEPGEVVGVYTHQMVIASATCAARGEPLVRWRDNRVGNTHMTALAWVAGAPRVVVQRVPLGDDAEAEVLGA